MCGPAHLFPQFAALVTFCFTLNNSILNILLASFTALAASPNAGQVQISLLSLLEQQIYIAPNLPFS